VPQSPSQSQTLGRHLFTATDQQDYGRLSGDHNPMHIDAMAARRLLSGRLVVHGMHTATLLLERWLAHGGHVPATLRCDFSQPINVGDELVMAAEGTRPVCLLARVGDLPCTILRLDDEAPPVTALDTGGEDFSSLAAPLAHPPASWFERCGRVRLSDGDGASMFPHLQLRLGGEAARALAALSYIVGMVCPGLHSIFSSFELRWGTGDELNFRVDKVDPRFRLVSVTFTGALNGSFRAFVRPEPQRQATMDELAPLISPQAFSNTRSLIVGGSRGLGELTAKMVCAGGGEVTITYAQGAEDAERVAVEVATAGRGTCRTRRFVAGESQPDELLETLPVDALFYFATSRIARRSAQGFDLGLFNDFFAIYATGFNDLASWLAAAQPARKARLFYPSSVYVSDRPRGMTEYAMAKAAAEVLVAELARTFRGLEFVCERLPRMSTDQTATLLPVATAPNVETMLPLVHRMLARGDVAIPAAPAAAAATQATVAALPSGDRGVAP